MRRIIHAVDLNLLVMFVAVMRDRSTTGPAQRLFVGQPAVSHALRRLRAIFDDRLFVRVRQGMVPTPRAEVLYHGLLPSLEAIERSLQERDHSEPGPSERVFRLDCRARWTFASCWCCWRRSPGGRRVSVSLCGP